LIKVLHLHENGILELADNLLLSKISVVLFFILSRLLPLQHSNGSWGRPENCADTSYAIIVLTYLASLPFVAPLSSQISMSVMQGREYLNEIRNVGDNGLKPSTVGEGGYQEESGLYLLTALNAPSHASVQETRKVQLFEVPLKKVEKFTKFYAKLQTFKSVEEWKIKIWLIQGYLYMPQLQSTLSEVFSREGSDEDLYLDYIPFTLTAANGLAQANMSPQTLLDLMKISIVIYQTDEFFDGIMANGDQATIRQAQKSIDQIMSQLNRNCKLPASNGIKSLHSYDQKIHQQLSGLLRYVLLFPGIQNASNNDKALLASEFKAYLVASLQQCEDNLRFKNQRDTRVYSSPPSTYIKWVRTTAVEHGSWQYAFSFMICLLSNGEDFLHNLEIKYIAQDCVARLSVLARMWNDYGSLSRDRKEVNLNSMFFPEFVGDNENKSDKELRMELERVANYEKRRLESSFTELEKVCGSEGSRVYGAVNIFSNITDIYNEIYRIRDVSNWL
jgi:hypothetical protein